VRCCDVNQYCDERVCVSSVHAMSRSDAACRQRCPAAAAAAVHLSTRRSSLCFKQSISPDDVTSSHTLMTSLTAPTRRSTPSLHATVRGYRCTCFLAPRDDAILHRYNSSETAVECIEMFGISDVAETVTMRKDRFVKTYLIVVQSLKFAVPFQDVNF